LSRGAGRLTRGAVGEKFILKLQANPTLIQSKSYAPKLQKFKWKYGAIGFKNMNNFYHLSFSRFVMEFELKIWEFKVYFWL
jgi:hypothetical protein